VAFPLAGGARRAKAPAALPTRKPGPRLLTLLCWEFTSAPLRGRGTGNAPERYARGVPYTSPISRVHAELLQIARDDAKLILSRDPELQSSPGEALRVLLYLFQRDAAVRYFRSGQSLRPRSARISS
jgi:hypothetical protein